jgi:hypothetical protein
MHILRWSFTDLLSPVYLQLRVDASRDAARMRCTLTGQVHYVSDDIHRNIESRYITIIYRNSPLSFQMNCPTKCQHILNCFQELPGPTILRYCDAAGQRVALHSSISHLSTQPHPSYPTFSTCNAH